MRIVNGFFATSRVWRTIGAALLVAVLLVSIAPSALPGPSAASGSPPLPSPTPQALAAMPSFAPAPPTYHPVVVPAGNTTYWNGTGKGNTRFQQGSVTVEAGGTLIVQNLTLSMVQFVATSGTLASRLSNVSRFLDEGKVVLRDAILTTDANVTDAYLKLNFTVTGTLSLWDSSLEFPGWLNIEDSATATLNGSLVTANPDVNSTGLDRTILADTAYAASISVTTGSHLILLNSRLEDTYADNTTSDGAPGPMALTDNDTVTVSPTSSAVLAAFQTPTSVQSLIQDWLYPIAYPSVDLVIEYSMSTGSVTSEVNVTFNGSVQVVAAVTFSPGIDAMIDLALPSPLLAAINSAGPLGFLQSTGSFDHNPPFISVGFNATGIGTSSATIEQTRLVASPDLSFNVACIGAGSTIESADSAIDLTWEKVPASPRSTIYPYPWDSNKLVVDDGAEALLANLSIPTVLPSADVVSAVQAGLGSVVYSYRWAEFDAQGPGGAIPGAKVIAFSSAHGENNSTANGLNDLSRASPTLWAYVQWWDGENGLPGYGITGSAGSVAGHAFLLLAASNLTDTEAASPSFIGGYHVGVTTALTGIPPQWLGFNVTPYPERLVNPTPDVAPTAFFPQYAASLAIREVSFTADGENTTGQVRIGQLLGVSVLTENIGATAVFNVSGLLQYAPPEGSPPIDVAVLPLTPWTVPAGTSVAINFTWRVNETIVGAHGTIPAGVDVTIDWNGGASLSDGGDVNTGQDLEILPSTVTILQLTAPPHTLSSTGPYVSAGSVEFNGSGLASINLSATPVNGGAPALIATNLSLSGSFELVYSNLGAVLQPGVAYLLIATASYNGQASTPYVLAGNYTVAASAASSQGLVVPWWVWLVVAAGAIAAITVFLVRRRRPAPLIECGECSSLVAADSTVCPICGIYFETGEGRCARCGGPIAAGELACPECGYLPSDRPGPPGPEEDREAYRRHVEEFRAAAQGELGEDYPEVEFWKWWRRQPSYQSFRDWKTGQGPPPSKTTDQDSDPLGIGDGR